MGPVLYHLHRKPHRQSLASHSEVYINKYVYNKVSNILMRQARKSERAHHFLLCAVKSNSQFYLTIRSSITTILFIFHLKALACTQKEKHHV